MLFAKGFKHRVGERLVVVTGGAQAFGRPIGKAQKYELLRVRQRKVAKQNGVHDAEDRGVSADAKGEGEDGDERETRRFAQHTEREAEVLKEGFKEGQAAPVAVGFFCLLDAAELYQRITAGGFRRHSRSKIVFNVESQMALHLRLELCIASPLAEQAEGTMEPSAHCFHTATSAHSQR